MLIGALAAFFLATAATLILDIHGIGDWFISSIQVRNPASICGTLYTIARYFGEPLLIISIAILTVGLYGSRLKYHRSIALIAMIIGILYILERVFWSYVATNFANSIQIHPAINDYTVLTQAGFLKGQSALLGGLIRFFERRSAIFMQLRQTLIPSVCDNTNLIRYFAGLLFEKLKVMLAPK